MDSLRLDLTVATRSFDVELSLDVARETVALVGPSGAGKTTVLRAVAGLRSAGHLGGVRSNSGVPGRHLPS